ncbi:MAG: SGNH/GDSL hydrolase family protein [Acidobacteriaceae bacterium]
MRLFHPSSRLATLASTLILAATPALAQTHWVATWGTAPVAKVNTANAFTMPTTLREIVHVSIGGSNLRVILTNEQGASPLIIDDAAVALPAASPDTAGAAAIPAGAIQPQSSVDLTFNGHPAVTIPPGTIAVSDPIPFALAPLSNLAISLSVAGQKVATITQHELALQTSYSAPGDQASATTLANSSTNTVCDFLKGVEVESPHGAAIVAFGDSITDGWRSTSGANTTWPDILADRLHADPATRDLGVLNMGIGGNRILHEGWGPNALSRFDNEVLQPAGVKYVIILEGINDIGHAYDLKRPYDIVSADDLITGISQLALRAHAHGIKVFGATLTPYLGAGYASPAGEAVRQAVNKWIRTTHQLDGFIDFDAATSNPTNPTVYAPADDSGDHLHPNDTGYKAMGDAINLKLFTKQP